MVAPAPLILALAALMALPGCISPGPSHQADVVATSYPLTWVSQRIAGDALTVQNLVDAGVQPHDFEPVPSDVQTIAGAQLVVRQGAGFDRWLDDLLTNLGADGPAVVDTTGRLELIGHDDDEDEDEHGHGDIDPHTWLDPILLQDQARAVARAMAEAWPEHEAAFASNLARLNVHLQELDASYRAGLADCQIRFAIVGHDSFRYLGQRYNVTFEAVSGLSPEAEPSPRTMDHLTRLAREHNVTIVFYEEFVSARTVQVLADEVDAEARVLSPLAGVTQEQAERDDHYLEAMGANLANLREAMRCR